MKLQWYIDDQLVDDPKGWESLQSAIQRDRTTGALTIKQEGTFNFEGTAFLLLWNKFQNQSFEGISTVKVMEAADGISFTVLFEGLIFLSDVEFDLKLKLCKAKLYDQSYQAKIANNRSVGAFLYASRSKLDLPITPITPERVHFFYPSNGVYLSSIGNGTHQNYCYRLFDVMRFLVDFMSDGELNFKSDAFDVGGEYYDYFITTGRVLQLVDTTHPDYVDLNQVEFEKYWDKVSWADVYDEVRKRFNVGFLIENGDTLRVEKSDFFRSNIPAFAQSILNTDELSVKTFTDQLYSKVVFGSSGEIDEGLARQFPELISFLGFKQEEFQTMLKTNIDKSLNLKCNWITSSNVIEKMIVDGLQNERDNDRKVFLIECRFNVGTNQIEAKQANWLFSAPPMFYNYELTNYKIAQRFGSEIPIDIVTYLNSLSNGDFRASVDLTRYINTSFNLPINQTTQEFCELIIINAGDTITPPNSNPAGVWGVAPYRWTCPTNGVYSFGAYAKVSYRFIQFTNFSNNMFLRYVTYKSRIVMRHYDSGGNVINNYYAPYNSFQYVVNGTLDQTHEMTLNERIICAAGDYIEFYVESCKKVSTLFADSINNNIVFYDFTLWQDSYVTCRTDSNGGGIGWPYAANEFPSIAIETKYPMTREQFIALRDNPTRYIDLSRHDEQIFRGRIESLKYNHINKEAQILLSGNKLENF